MHQQNQELGLVGLQYDPNYELTNTEKLKGTSLDGKITHLLIFFCSSILKSERLFGYTYHFREY